MSCEFRAIWVFYQGGEQNEVGVNLVASRRFPTVECRLRQLYRQSGTPFHDIPVNEAVHEKFVSGVLKERSCSGITIETMSPSLKSELAVPVFAFDPPEASVKSEKLWPQGPTCMLGEVWPFIYISSDGSYEETPASVLGRYYICGILGVSPSGIKRPPILEYPEVSAGFGVLESLLEFLPSAAPNAGWASKFLYQIKTALPFGSPVFMSLDVINDFESSGTAKDTAILSQSTGQTAGHRIPSWKPFPTFACSGALKLHVVESVSFEVSNKGVLYSSVSGKLLCESDISGSPEVILVVSSPGKLTFQLHDCAKLLTSSSEDGIRKISLIPLAKPFTVCDFTSVVPLDTCSLPIEGSFKLFQIAPQQFRFTLFVKLKILFSHVSVTFGVNPVLKILSTTHLTHSTKTKFENSSDSSFVWTFKNPATYNPEGEHIEGLIETERALLPGEVVSRNACINFRAGNCYLSNLAILKDNVSIFPNPGRTNISVSYEMVSSGECHVLNSASKESMPSAETSSSVNMTDTVDLSVICA